MLENSTSYCEEPRSRLKSFEEGSCLTARCLRQSSSEAAKTVPSGALHEKRRARMRNGCIRAASILVVCVFLLRRPAASVESSVDLEQLYLKHQVRVRRNRLRTAARARAWKSGHSGCRCAGQSIWHSSKSFLVLLLITEFRSVFLD